MPVKGQNKFGLVLEDFNSYEDYKKEYDRLEKKSHRLAHKEQIKEYNKSYYSKNKEYLTEINRDWKNKNKELVKEYNKEYTEKNRSKINAKNSKYRASKLQATPVWSDMKAIEKFYMDCPEGYEVDHIIPLKGKNVSGLHVLNNLQYLTKSENCRKRNKVML